MIGFEEQEKVRALLREAVTVLCRNGLPGCGDLSVEGLLGITLENREVFLVKIDERITQDGSSGGSPDTELVAGVSPTPTSNSTRQRKRNRDTTSANAGLSQKSSDEPYNKKVRDSGGGGDDGRVAAEDSDDSENETEKQENEKDNENREQDNNSPMVTASTTTAATPQKVKTETTNETGSDVTSESNSATQLEAVAPLFVVPYVTAPIISGKLETGNIGIGSAHTNQGFKIRDLEPADKPPAESDSFSRRFDDLAVAIVTRKPMVPGRPVPYKTSPKTQPTVRDILRQRKMAGAQVNVSPIVKIIRKPPATTQANAPSSGTTSFVNLSSVALKKEKAPSEAPTVPDTVERILIQDSYSIAKSPTPNLYNSSKTVGELLKEKKQQQQLQTGVAEGGSAVLTVISPTIVSSEGTRNTTSENVLKSAAIELPRDREEMLANHIAQMASLGYRYYILQVLQLATQMAEYYQLKSPDGSLINERWYSAFLSRWPQALVNTKILKILPPETLKNINWDLVDLAATQDALQPEDMKPDQSESKQSKKSAADMLTEMVISGIEDNNLEIVDTNQWL